jgi:hypothetical protein
VSSSRYDGSTMNGLLCFKMPSLYSNKFLLSTSFYLETYFSFWLLFALGQN